MAVERKTSKPKTTGKKVPVTAKKTGIKKAVGVPREEKKRDTKVIADKNASEVSVVHGSLTATVLDVHGKETKKIQVPKEFFAAEVNTQLINQAIRVFLANKRELSASTKTRGEVDGSTRKIFRQKGTGRARHGSVRAPIFVGGGIAFGPHIHTYSLRMPQKMRLASMKAALTSQFLSGNVVFVSGLQGLEPKTKLMFDTLKTLGITQKVMIITGEHAEGIVRSGRNIPTVTIVKASGLNTYSILASQKILMTTEGLELLQSHFLKQ